MVDELKADDFGVPVRDGLDSGDLETGAFDIFREGMRTEHIGGKLPDADEGVAVIPLVPVEKIEETALVHRPGVVIAS